jgi:hypothetical protein
MTNKNKNEFEDLLGELEDVGAEVSQETENQLAEIIRTLIKLAGNESLDGNRSQKQRIETIITMLEKKDLTNEIK